MTEKQKEEIEFLTTYFMEGIIPTHEECEEYLLNTVHGIGGQKVAGMSSVKVNPLIVAKRKFNIACSMWREDLVVGLLGADELKEDFGRTRYINKTVDSLVNSVTKEYRIKILTKRKKEATVLAFTNFPSIMNVLEK